MQKLSINFEILFFTENRYLANRGEITQLLENLALY